VELVLKLPKNKPPFIGVLFANEQEAAILNADWADRLKNCTFQLLLDPSHRLYITLLMNDGRRGERYEVSYDPVALLKFLHYTKDSGFYNFGHLYFKLRKYQLAKTKDHSPLLFSIDKITVVMLTVEN
jgi:hypothetical protein